MQGIAESTLQPAFAALSRALGEPVPLYPVAMLAGAVGGIAAALQLAFVAPWSLVGLTTRDWAPARLATGALLGTAAVLLTAGMLWAVGALRFEGAATSDGLTPAGSWGMAALRLFLVLAPAALWEELAFRGLLQGALDEATNQRVVARALSSIAFGLVHLDNPGAGVRTTGIVMLAGWCLALVREQRGLPAAFTAHLAWNWIMAAVLHVPVSGLPFSTPGYRALPSGPAWLSGGAWGPEGSLIAALVLAAAAWYWRRPVTRAERIGSPSTSPLTSS